MTLEDSVEGSTARSHRRRSVLDQPVDPPLCQACQSNDFIFFDPGCTGCRELLLAPNISTSEIFAILRQWTPQTQQNMKLLVDQFFECGGAVNDKDLLTDMTLLQYVTKSGAKGMGDPEEVSDLIKVLIEKGADVYSRCRWTNMAAIHYAVFFDIVPAVRTLLKASAAIDINCTCSEFSNSTLLHIAAANLCLETMEVLLHYGADVNCKDVTGKVPADYLPNDPDLDPKVSQTVEAIKTLLRTSKGRSVQRKSTYQASASTAALQALGLRINDKVIVGGIKTGILRFTGHTKFGSGIWAGIELDEPVGKNDGSVSGVRYFSCAPRHGVFAPLSKISSVNVKSSTPPRVNHGKVDISRVTAKIDTGLRRGQDSQVSVAVPPDDELSVGDTVLVAGKRRGVVRFSGPTDFAPGWWYGVDLTQPAGRNDGSLGGKRYFTCKPRHGVFAPPGRVVRMSSRSGSRESLDSMNISDTQRRLSVESSSSSTPLVVKQRLSLPTSAPQRQTTRHLPKSSGSAGPYRRSMTRLTDTKLQEGMTVVYCKEQATLRYIGPVDFAEGVWLGLELRQAVGKNDGSVHGHRYFTCRQSYGVLARPQSVMVNGVNAGLLLTPQQQLQAATAHAV